MEDDLMSREPIPEQREADDLLRVSLPHLTCLEGDTLVIVEFPPSDARNCRGFTWNSAQFRMSSEKLLGIGSSVITSGLSEQNQHRYRRRHKHILESIPPEVKYILDLTPSPEGDETAFLVGELSLPVGVRDWWMARERLGVSGELVSGHDDHCRDHAEISSLCVKSPDWESGTTRNQSADATKYGITLRLEHCLPCAPREIRDYCEIRHRANIIRLLLVVAGYDLVLNSAPRVYTIVALAKQLDLVNLVVSPVRAWLEDHRNSSFIDIHPEIALEMAWKLQLSDLARATLRVLVVERALEPAHSRIISNVTKFGRPRTSLSDDISTVVEHATESIRIRCQEASDNIFSENPYDWLQLPSWGLFMQIGTVLAADIAATGDMQLTDKITEEICEHHKRVNGRLLHYITSAISRAFDAVKAGTVIGANRLGEMDNDRLAYANGDVGFQSTKQIMTSMSKEQILLMPLFWNRLRIEVAEYEAFRDCCNAGREMIMLTTLLNKAVGEGMFSSLRAEHPMSVPLGPISFHDELCREIDKLSRDWVPFYGNLEVPLHRTTHLALGFAEDEFKFLPLWAGGLDDETGAVFDDMDVPDTDMGPNQPGPAYITGKTIAPSSTADSDITIIGGGMSVQAVQSGANTNASVSKTTGSFVKVSPSETSNLENLDLMHSDTKSMRSAMGGIGIFSDSSTRSLRNAMDDIGMASESDEVGDIESSHNIDDDDDDDAQSLAANPDDITADSDSMSDDSDWTDIYN